jgi:predicted peptidase
MTKIFSLLSLFFLCLFYKIQDTPHYHYLTYLPQKYDATGNKKWPLIIYLHGKSACGDDLSKVSRYGLPFFTERGMQLDAVAVSPQCPTGKNWTSDDWLLPLLKEVTLKYRIDTTRIYLTGMSLGGFGTWDLAIKYPHKFAAIAPLCGGGRPQSVCAIKDVPVWVIHGDQDEQVPISRSIEMVEALKNCGGNPKFTVLKGYPHDIHRTYGDENLYKWMLQFSLNKSEADNRNIALQGSEDKFKSNKPSRKRAEKKKKTTSEEIANTQQKIPEAKPSRKKFHSEAQTDTIKGKNFTIVF